MLSHTQSQVNRHHVFPCVKAKFPFCIAFTQWCGYVFYLSKITKESCSPSATVSLVCVYGCDSFCCFSLFPFSLNSSMSVVRKKYVWTPSWAGWHFHHSLLLCLPYHLYIMLSTFLLSNIQHFIHSGCVNLLPVCSLYGATVWVFNI